MALIRRGLVMYDYIARLGRKNTYKAKFKALYAAIDNAPAVDAVEVVRCKDCVNMGKHLPLPKGYREDCGCCMAHGWIVSPESFCNWGETADEKDSRDAAEHDAYEQLCNLGNPEDGSL